MKELKYALRGVTIDQFAKLSEPMTDDIDLSVQVPVKANYQERAFAVGANVRFTENGVPFLIAEVFCHYEIEKNCWDKLSDDNTKDVVLLQQWIDPLVMIAFGAARGVLCAKTENTALAKFFLPLIEAGFTSPGNDFVIKRD